MYKRQDLLYYVFAKLNRERKRNLRRGACVQFISDEQTIRRNLKKNYFDNLVKLNIQYLIKYFTEEKIKNVVVLPIKT